MKVKTHVKAGLLPGNHNETMVRNHRKSKGLKVKTSVKAGARGGASNHNETLESLRRPSPSTKRPRSLAA